MKAPQITYCIMVILGLVADAILDGRKIKVDFGKRLVGAIVTSLVLWWGGFFT